ncbi:MAG: AraC family transcriptional regulator [Eubacteriales bacterium]|nr:AraC family transcriptional regulator [Eubacteriales bacterium]
MKKALSDYIENIIRDTKRMAKPNEDDHCHMEADKTKEPVTITEADLEHMIANSQKDILINAHIPEFDNDVRPHNHDFYELIHVYRGSVRMTIHNRNFIFHTGDFVLLNPTVIHSIALNEADTKSVNVLMKRSLFNKSFLYIILDNPMMSHFFLPSVSKDSQAKNYMIYREAAQNNPMLDRYLLNLFDEYLKNEAMSASALEINLAGLCIELSRSHRETVKTQSVKREFSIADICKYITLHLQGISLEETAEYFHYNPKYFSSMLKKIYGKTFSGLLQELRMNSAMQLLTKTDITVNEIIHSVGYENTTHFYRVFENYYGMKPGQCRDIKTRQKAGSTHC